MPHDGASRPLALCWLHDLYYIENWSLLFDLWIIVRTIGLVLLHDGEAF